MAIGWTVWDAALSSSYYRIASFVILFGLKYQLDFVQLLVLLILQVDELAATVLHSIF